jgi:hypothetical protein
MALAGEHAPAETARPGEVPAPPSRPAPTERVLALQRAAGNRAVGTLLARAPKAKPKPAPKEPESLAERRVSHIVLEGMAPIEAEGWSWAGASANNRDLQVTVRQGAHSSELMRAVTEGREFPHAELNWYGRSGGGFRVRFTGVMITSYHVAGGEDALLEHYTLNARDVHVEVEPAP